MLNPRTHHALSSRVAKKWQKLPKGWTQESVNKLWGSLTKEDPDHPVQSCIDKMEGKLDNPGAYCGGLADEMIPGWRQERAKKAATSPKIDTRTRQVINAKLSKSGLDGNGRFSKAEQGYSRALEVLATFGIELDGVVSSHQFRQPSANIRVNLAWSNPSDPFSPTSITNSVLALQYTELRDGVFEVLAYLS